MTRAIDRFVLKMQLRKALGVIKGLRRHVSDADEETHRRRSHLPYGAIDLWPVPDKLPSALAPDCNPLGAKAMTRLQLIPATALRRARLDRG
jgi:hypothetical protein